MRINVFKRTIGAFRTVYLRETFCRERSKILGTLAILFWATVAFSQPVINVKGSSNAGHTKRQVRAYLNQLDVQESIHLTVRFSNRMPKQLEGITLSLPSPEPKEYQLLKILINARLSRSKQELVLAHEMIHVKQYAKGELIALGKNKVMWQDRERYYARAYNRATPWEKEAYRGDRTLAELVKPLPNITQETLLAQVSDHVSKAFSQRCSSARQTAWSGKCAISENDSQEDINS